MSMAAVPGQARDLTGTLAKIRDAGVITLGYRVSAMPFSYQLPAGEPAGYAVDLCLDLVQDISAALGGVPLSVAFQPVTVANRIDKVVSGAIDMECGSTTQNPQRLEKVAFSPIFFIAATKLLVPRQSMIRSYRDLQGHTVAVTAGTTNETAIRALAGRMLVHMNIVTAPDHAQSFQLLRAGKADAFATDDVLLVALAATPEGAGFTMADGPLSYEPYGLMYRRNDPAFGAVLEAGFRRLVATGRLDELYNRWLMRQIPTGETLNIPMSMELAQVLRQFGRPE